MSTQIREPVIEADRVKVGGYARVKANYLNGLVFAVTDVDDEVALGTVVESEWGCQPVGKHIWLYLEHLEPTEFVPAAETSLAPAADPKGSPMEAKPPNRRIARVLVSPDELFDLLAGRSKVTGKPLPPDANLIHWAWDKDRCAIEVTFSSEANLPNPIACPVPIINGPVIERVAP